MYRSKKEEKRREELLNKIPVFLAKTYRIVDEAAYKDSIGWCEDGKAFQIRNLSLLTGDVFPKHFKHSNFASFVRQLNMYGFHKVRSEEEGHIYMHECFLRDEVEKLLQIKRRAPSPNCETLIEDLSPPREEQLEREVDELKLHHSTLQNYVQMLADQTRAISKQNTEYLLTMSEMREDYRRRIEALLLYMIFGKNLKQSEKREFVASYLKSMLSAYDHNNQLPHAHRALVASDSLSTSKPLPSLHSFFEEGDASVLPAKKNDLFSELIKKIDKPHSLTQGPFQTPVTPFRESEANSPFREEFLEFLPSPISNGLKNRPASQDDDWQQFLEDMNKSSAEQQKEKDSFSIET